MIVTDNLTSTVDTSTGSTGGSQSTNDLMNMDMFLTLLVTEMQNQNPLDPVSNEEFMQQLAYLSTVEQLSQVNDNFETLHLYQASLNNAQSVSLIGKTVKALGEHLVVGSEGQVPISFYPASEPEKVTVTITDSSDTIVRVLEYDYCEEGENTVNWDGLDTDGNRVPAGEYTFEVTAEDEAGEAVKVDTFINGVVDSIKFEGGVPCLSIDGHFVYLSDVYEIQ